VLVRYPFVAQKGVELLLLFFQFFILLKFANALSRFFAFR